MRVRLRWVAVARSRLVARLRAEDWRHALLVVAKANREVPLVADLGRLHSSPDRVILRDIELGVPVRIGRPAALVEAADPLLESISGLALRHFDAVVHAQDSSAACYEPIERLEMTIEGVATAAVGVEHDGVGVVEGRGVLRPAVVVVVGGDDALDLAQPFREQAYAGVELVFPGRVRWSTGDEDDLLSTI